MAAMFFDVVVIIANRITYDSIGFVSFAFFYYKIYDIVIKELLAKNYLLVNIKTGLDSVHHPPERMSWHDAFSSCRSWSTCERCRDPFTNLVTYDSRVQILVYVTNSAHGTSVKIQ
jgi:hypothetical protein